MDYKQVAVCKYHYWRPVLNGSLWWLRDTHNGERIDSVRDNFDGTYSPSTGPELRMSLGEAMKHVEQAVFV